MSNQRNTPTALPKPLQKAADELRSVQLPEDFQARLNNALVAADQTSWTLRARPSLWTRAGGPWLALVPGAAGMALMLHLAFGAGTEGADEMWHQAQSQEVELLLDDAGHSWVSLDLLTHHHDGQEAIVRVDAPHNVQVKTSEHAEHHEDSPVCAAQRCVHSFSQPTSGAPGRPLQVGVAEPGRYRISVEHASSGGRVREEFVVHARR